MAKIQMKTPLVEMDGDEMTRILWQQIKEELLEPYIDLKTEYYDLGLPHREETGDQVTIDAAEANKKYGVAVKCATITPNAQRVEEYKLSQMWKSPNGTIRAILDGTVFRAPIMVKGLNPVVKNWKEPITIARHAFGDVYRATEYRVPGAGKAELVFTAEDGTETRQTIQAFRGPGVLQGQFNLDKSITSFAHSCFAGNSGGNDGGAVFVSLVVLNDNNGAIPFLFRAYAPAQVGVIHIAALICSAHGA